MELIDAHAVRPLMPAWCVSFRYMQERASWNQWDTSHHFAHGERCFAFGHYHVRLCRDLLTHRCHQVVSSDVFRPCCRLCRRCLLGNPYTSGHTGACGMTDEPFSVLDRPHDAVPAPILPRMSTVATICTLRRPLIGAAERCRSYQVSHWIQGTEDCLGDPR